MAVAAPAAPATRNAGALQRKSSCQTVQSGCLAESAIAPATSPVFTTKYVAIATRSGFESSARSTGTVSPPSHPYVRPVACIVMTAAAVLNTVRYSGYGTGRRHDHREMRTQKQQRRQIRGVGN